MNKITKWAARAMVPALLAGGAATFALAGAGPALADGPPSNAPSVTTATVTVSESTTITDNTASITFTAPPALPSTATPANQPVSVTVTNNDPTGYDINVTAGGDFTGSAGTMPISGLQVTGGNGTFRFGEGTMQPSAFPDSGNDVTTGHTYMETYALDIPNGPPGTASTTLQYSVAGK